MSRDLVFVQVVSSLQSGCHRPVQVLVGGVAVAAEMGCHCCWDRIPGCVLGGCCLPLVVHPHVEAPDPLETVRNAREPV